MSNSRNIYLQYFVNMKPALFLVAAAALIVFAFVPLGDTKATNPSGDCDSNSIIYCGSFSTGELANDYAKLDAKGKAAYANAGVNPAKFGSTVMGAVTRDNRVVVNGKTVATNVYTYGRGYMSGSVQISGGAYMRHPSVSFRSASIPAFVYMKDGVFQWAVITTCGNPVKGTPTAPTPKPSHTIQKKVTTDLKASTDAAYFYGKESVLAQKGQTVRFVTMATNTGNVNLDSYVSDSIPAGTSFVKGTYQVKQGTKVTATGSVKRLFDGSYGWTGVLKPGQEVKIDIWVKYNTTSKVRNIACISNKPAGKKCDDAYVEPQPEAACVSLTATKISRDTYKFEGKASVKDGAKIQKYSFKPSRALPAKVVTTSSSSATTQVTYPQPGTYRATLTVVTSLGNRSGDQCSVAVKVEAPSAVCDSLAADSVDRLTRRLTVASTITNGATISGYSFDFGDGTKQETTTPTAVHEYQPGSYTAKVTLHTSLGDKTSEACKLRIQIADQDEPALDVEKRVTADLKLGADESGYDKAKELITVSPDTVVKFIIKFTNIGNIALEDVKLKDALPEGLSLQEGELERVIQKIEPGESAYFEITATASESIGNTTVTNVVCVAHDTDGDGEVELNCDKDCPKNPEIEAGEDLKDCDDAKVRINAPGTPSTLPRTGIESVLSGFGGLGLTIAAARSWIVSRRKLMMAHLNK